MRYSAHLANRSRRDLLETEQLLIEYQTFGSSQLHSAFLQLHEALLQEVSAAQKQYNQNLSNLLQAHNNNVQATFEAIRKFREQGVAGLSAASPDSSKPLTADHADRLLHSSQGKTAVATLKHAFSKWYELANRKVPLVANPKQWIDSKLQEIISQINKIDDNSRFGPFKRKISQIVEGFRNAERLTPGQIGMIVALIGVLAGLIGTGASWAVGAGLIFIRFVLNILSGESFGKAAAKTLGQASIGALLGFGLGSLISSIADAQTLLASADPADYGAGPEVAGLPGPPPPTPLVSSAYVNALRDVVDPSGEGVGIPTMTQNSFGSAWRAAREAMGPGHVFVWNGQPYTTNNAEEGLLNGLSQAARNFLRGVRL
jgi:hypothetical protein